VVVVKVQRPGIAQIVQTDLAALRVVARWAIRYRPIRRRADVPALMDEFAATLWEELDYQLEADNAEKFGRIFAQNSKVCIPGVYREHSTGRVLVLENVDGIKITDTAQMDAEGIDRAQVADHLMDVYFQQIFKEGFFHADPHPGNLFIQPLPLSNGTAVNGERPFRLAFVDFGMVGRIETLTGENLKRVLISVTRRDAQGLTEAYNDLGFFLPGSDLDRIAEAQATLLDHLWGRNLLELSQPDAQEVQELGKEFRDILFEFPFQIPRNFVYLGRTMGMLSGLASQLDPMINPWRLIERYGREIIRSQEGRDLTLSTILEWLQPLISLPAQVQRVVAAAESGRLKVKTTPDRTLLRRLERLERQAGRLNWNVLLGVLFLSGTLLYINGENGLGIAAWLAAAILLVLNLLMGD
jgi:predicted unusual protein kinase regulating ubiquinone biosynthesis (AarF/ABC1/UbiB family)